MRLAGLQRLAEQSGATDIALGVPRGGPPPSVQEGVSRAISAGEHHYADPRGLPELRASVAGLVRGTHGVDIDPETELTITCGATEGMFIALLAVTDPGDEVIILEPFFELYPGMVRLAGAVPVPVHLASPAWRLTEAALNRAVSPRTRAILMNTPHNPTGRVFDEAEWRMVRDVCVRNDLTCITDEVYEHFVFDDLRHRSPLGDPQWRPDGRSRPSAHVIAVSSLSKTLEVTGWRIGYCIAPPDMTAALRRAHEHTTLGTARPLQAGAAAMPDPGTLRTMLASRRNVLVQARDLMVCSMQKAGLETTSPDGGWYVIAGTAALGLPSSDLAAGLVQDAGVLVAPGAPFFADPAEGDRWIRTTFVRDPDSTTAALGRLTSYLGQL
jgi:aspartate/methionine/tyrosine aminotransferase